MAIGLECIGYPASGAFWRSACNLALQRCSCSLLIGMRKKSNAPGRPPLFVLFLRHWFHESANVAYEGCLSIRVQLADKWQLLVNSKFGNLLPNWKMLLIHLTCAAHCKKPANS